MRFLWLALILCAAHPLAPALAQTFPDRPLKLIVPTGAGSSPDIHARLFATELATLLGQPVVVENVAGAAGIIGTERAMKSASDGYTLLYGYNQLVTMNPALYAKLPYDPAKDMQPVTHILNGSYIWITAAGSGIPGMREWLAQAKAQPGRLTYGTGGTGTAAHLGGALLETMAGIDLLHVPYKTGPAAVTDVLGGQVGVTMEPTGSAVRLVQGGKMRALAVTSAARLAVLPEVPAVSEILPGYEVLGWHAIWAPMGTPAPVVARLNSELRKVLALPAIRKRLADVALEPTGSTPEEVAAITAREAAVWSRLIREKRIRIDQSV
ncbi:MAG: tripartite tricarboxylate transporter substrate binding protein [Burkholderiales bacterium]|nr:tripartite tricarboxylate transporter substrate binding protein [Burkholderiales bacterium]